MADSFIQVPADGVGKKLRSSEIVVGANTVHEQYMRIAPQGGPDSVQFFGTATNRAINEWTSLQNFLIPAGFYAQPMSFRALSATAGYGGRAIYMRKLGTINLVNGTYTDTGAAASPGSYFAGLMVVTPLATTTATTLTITFTDDQGTASRTATQALALNQPAASRLETALPLRQGGGDVFGRATTLTAGIRDVTNVSRSVASTNTADLYGFDVISYLRCVAANTVYSEQLDPHLYALQPGDILSVESNSYATAVASIVQERQLLFQLSTV